VNQRLRISTPCATSPRQKPGLLQAFFYSELPPVQPVESLKA